MIVQADLNLEEEVAAICDLSREHLVTLWVKTYGRLPPKGVKRGLLERSAAWHLQAKRLGGLSAHARGAIRQYAKQKEAGRQLTRGRLGVEGNEPIASPDFVTPKSESKAGPPSPSTPAIIKPSPVPGTRLIREWNGRIHVVDITEEGVLFNGRLYRSLTAVAKRITGTHWSGPRFFGL